MVDWTVYNRVDVTNGMLVLNAADKEPFAVAEMDLPNKGGASIWGPN
jgi:hypothetical protein